jgi:hemerythrin-like domain-containing protein
VIAERLEQDHTVGRRLAAASGQAVDAYTACQTESGAKLAAAARGYASFLREHIDLETREVLPAVEGPLAAYRGEANGAGTTERLHGMIDGLPARINPYVRPSAD